MAIGNGSESDLYRGLPTYETTTNTLSCSKVPFFGGFERFGFRTWKLGSNERDVKCHIRSGFLPSC